MTDYEAAFWKLHNNWHNSVKHYENRITKLEAALRDIASGRYSGIVLTSVPPQDPAINRAKQALEGKDD